MLILCYCRFIFPILQYLPDGDVELLDLGGQVDGSDENLLGMVVHHGVPQVESLHEELKTYVPIGWVIFLNSIQ